MHLIKMFTKVEAKMQNNSSPAKSVFGLLESVHTKIYLVLSKTSLLTKVQTVQSNQLELNVAYPGVLAILDCLLLDGAADLGLIGLHTESISGCLEDRLSM